MTKKTGYLTGLGAITATAGVVSTGAGFSVDQLVSNAGGGMSQVAGFFKATGVLSLIVGLVFIFIKTGVVKIMVIQEGETGLLIKRGKVYLDKKTGLPRVVNSDRYQVHIAVLRHIAVVNNRERTVDLGSLPVTVEGVTWVMPLVLVWSILEGPEKLRDALIKVSDGNRFDEKFGALESMVKEQTIAGLDQAFRQATAGVDGDPPVVNFELVRTHLETSIGNYGGRYHELLPSPMYRYAEQHNKDGYLAIAKAIEASPLGIAPHLSSLPSVS